MSSLSKYLKCNSRWSAVIGSSVGYAMDGFDLLILGFILPFLTNDLHLTAVQAASLVTITLLGAVLGGCLFGILSDYLGRVRVLTWSILTFAVFTACCSFAQGYWDLAVYRGLSGVGIGGEYGIGMALVAEAWPARYRARASSYVGLGWQSGVFVAAILTPLLLPHIGWRGMFALGALPALAAYFMRKGILEPVASVEGESAASRSSTGLAFFVGNRKAIKKAIAVFIMCSVQNFGYYGVMVWLPNYLSSQLGYSMTKSGIWTAVTVVGMAVGMVVFGQVADKIGMFRSFLLWMIGAAVTVIVYAALTSPMSLLIVGAIMGFFVNGMIGGYGALISNLYPAQVRATAQNVLFNTGRAIGGFGPLVVGWLAQSEGFRTTIILLSLIYIFDIVALCMISTEARKVV